MLIILNSDWSSSITMLQSKNYTKMGDLYDNYV